MQAICCVPFKGARDGEVHPRPFKVGDSVEGELARAMVRAGFARWLVTARETGDRGAAPEVTGAPGAEQRTRARRKWELDLDGATVVIAASGPSQTLEALAIAKASGAVVIAINSTWRIAGEAAVLYGADARWWKRGAPKANEFAGLRISAERVTGLDAPVRQFKVAPDYPMRFDGEMLGHGGNSAYQAANLAALWGARRIILTGVDCKSPGDHWHGRHEGPAEDETNEGTIALWLQCWADAAKQLERQGVEVINCSPDSALDVFPRAALVDALPMAEARLVESEKYVRAYSALNYHMGAKRMVDAIRALKALPGRGSYLDVSTGRGEMLDIALELGFGIVRGTEFIPQLTDNYEGPDAKAVNTDRPIELAAAHDLPFADGAFDVVSMFDVIEHLLPGDDELACRELARVAGKHIILSANNRPSFNVAGDDLHINKRAYPEWDRLFRRWFPGKVIHLGGKAYVSELWRIDL